MQEEYEIYGGFASVYDEFMDNIPYDAWYEYLHGLLKVPCPPIPQSPTSA